MGVTLEELKTRSDQIQEQLREIKELIQQRPGPENANKRNIGTANPQRDKKIAGKPKTFEELISQQAAKVQNTEVVYEVNSTPEERKRIIEERKTKDEEKKKEKEKRAEEEKQIALQKQKLFAALVPAIKANRERQEQRDVPSTLDTNHNKGSMLRF